jgi:hypothetical protein
VRDDPRINGDGRYFALTRSGEQPEVEASEVFGGLDDDVVPPLVAERRPSMLRAI